MGDPEKRPLLPKGHVVSPKSIQLQRSKTQTAFIIRSSYEPERNITTGIFFLIVELFAAFSYYKN